MVQMGDITSETANPLPGATQPGPQELRSNTKEVMVVVTPSQESVKEKKEDSSTRESRHHNATMDEISRATSAESDSASKSASGHWKSLGAYVTKKKAHPSHDSTPSSTDRHNFMSMPSWRGSTPKKISLGRQESMAVMNSNHMRKKGKRAVSLLLGDMNRQEFAKLLAVTEMEQIVEGIISKFDQDKNEKKAKGFASLFQAIDKDGNGTINVSGELGETLIRLGIAVEVSVMHEAIHKVCRKRGRVPDDYYGTGVSLKIPIYNELDQTEFVEVMFALTTMTESGGDKKIKARSLFSAIDKDKDGRIDVGEFKTMMTTLKIDFDEEDVETTFANVTEETNGQLDFKAFLNLQGIEGKNEDYEQAELQERRRKLKEALSTFMAFDVDGGGTIDVVEIGAVMRAMGRRVSEDELEHMMRVADSSGKGEIDFEQFCIFILGMKPVEFESLIKAHKQKPVVVPSVVGSNKKTMSIEELAPSAWARSMGEEGLGYIVTEESNAIGQKFQRVSSEQANAEFLWEDYGQYAHLTFKHPTLDPTREGYDGRFAKAAIMRPFTFMSHKDHGHITMARFFPDGKSLAVTASDGSLRVFDLTRPRSKQVCNIIAHDHSALCLCLSPDGTRIVTGGADWAVSMWTAEHLDLISSELLHTGYVRYVDWSSDGQMIASCGSDMTVCLWHGDQFAPMDEPVLGHTSWVRWCKFTHDCKRLVTGSDDQTVMVWGVPSAHALQTLRAHSHTVSAGCLLANNKLFTAGFDEHVLLWTQDTGLLGYLKVFVVEAFDLKRGDTLTGSMSNQRFVTIELGKGQREQTSNKKGSSPHWFEEFNLSVWDLDESVVIQVYDWDKDESHRFLGELRIPLEELAYAEEGVTDREYDLTDDEGEKGKASIALRFTFREVQCIGEVTVLVERARNLPRMDTFGLSDPFCAVSVGKSERHKTKVVRRNLNPEWNEEFVYNVEEGARELKIVLYDWSVTKEEDFIGQVIFPIEKLMAEPFVDDWFRLKSIDGTADVRGEVKVTVKFLSEAERDQGASSLRFRRNPTTWPASSRNDFNYYSPIGQVVLFGRTIMRGRCRFCKHHRREHTNNLRCDLGTGTYVHSLDVSADGTMVAWGTGDGRIRVANLATTEQISCWSAHAGPVLGLQWSPCDLRLLSYGADFRGADSSSFVRGSYIPSADAKSKVGKNHVVEVWYVGSMVAAVKARALQAKKRHNKVDGLGPKGEGASGEQGNEGDDNAEQEEGREDDGSDVTDEDDEGDEDNDDSSRKKSSSQEDPEAEGSIDKEKARAKRVGEGMGLRKRRGHTKNVEGRVGYTPVYYDPPTKADGTPARSCLKGRGAKRPAKQNFQWTAADYDIFYYPPEYPEEEEEEEPPPQKVQKPRRKVRVDRISE